MTPSDETPNDAPPPSAAPEASPPESEAPKAPWWRTLKARMSHGRAPVVLAGLLIVCAFGGGFLTAKGVDILSIPRAVVSGDSVVPGGWSLFGAPRAADAPRRGIPMPEDFAVWRTRVDTSSAQPRACIEMSRPLDPEAAYGDYVLVSPELGETPAISVDGSELCLAGLGFTERRVTLLKGLPARGGETLAANADIDFTFGEKPPFVGFAGDGVILPREDSDGVGIETVNVTRLAIEVWRVADRNLVRTSVSAPEPTAEGEWPYDWGSDSPDQEGRKVWSGEVAVAGEVGRRATTVFPLGAVLRELKPGGYVIKARDASGGRSLTAGEDANPPAQARRWIIFTDMALSAYVGAEATDVVVRSLKTARPLSGIRVALVAANGEDLAEARTDGQGRARFAAALTQGEGGLRAKMIMAYGPQEDLAILDLDRPPADLSRLGVGGRIETNAVSTAGRTSGAVVDAYLYTDRGVYRPGETVHLNALLRDREARAAKDRKGAIIVRRPSGVEYRRYVFDGA
ncbi:MG2 domain-containing protein, partial [Phenylobacterium sp.]|uniref:MG2 domain-containing protein n=1 Tax=Phenylobacterium sp. TaxID=1871053 RepID=UPI00345D825E